MSAVQFVRSVKLKGFPDDPSLKRRQLARTESETPDNKKQGFVCGGSSISFTDNLKGQQKRDVLNGTLFAQLAANYKYNREDPEWYEYYVEVLGMIGYVTEKFEFTRYEGSGQTFKMDAVVLDILLAIATQDEIAVVKATLKAFEALKDDDNQVVLFDHYSRHLTNGGYQVFPCTTDSNNDVVLSLGGFYFTSDQRGVKILFFSYNTSSTSFYKSAQKTILNMDVYDQVRELIIEKLGDQAVTGVAEIPLGGP